MGRYEETLASFPEPLKAAGLPPTERRGKQGPVLMHRSFFC